MSYQETDIQIQALQAEISEKIEAVNALRKKRSLEPIENHQLYTKEGALVHLSDLFGDSDELLIIHNMGKGCAYCTLWADGFRGHTNYMQKRMPFVLISPDKPEVMKEFAEKGNWSYPYMSSHGSDFTRSLGFEREKEGKKYFSPGASALVKDEKGNIFRTGYDYFGPGDMYCPPWHFFDLFPKGANGWQPKYER